MSSVTRIILRPSHERQHADHGWLKTFHTFSVNPWDTEHQSWGSLRIINEDRVDPKHGFGLHPHHEFEIFSYCISGAIQHCDSMQNTEVIRRGDIQLTSAGTGIKHSERPYGPEEAHFLQVWSFPHTPGLKPAYYTRHVDDEEKEDKWVVVVAPAGSAGVTDEREGHGAAPVHSTLYVSATILSEGKALIHVQRSEKAYVHVPQISGYVSGKATGATVHLMGADGSETVLREGDGAYIIGSPGAGLKFENGGDRRAEVLVFDVDVEL